MSAISQHDTADSRFTKLQRLPLSHQLAFSASCCERAYPNYVRFFELAHWGNPRALRRALDEVWSYIENQNSGVSQIEQLESDCEAATPDLDDFSAADVDVEAAAAQEAAFMVRLLLAFCTDPQVSYARRIATFAEDTIDMFVQVSEHIDPRDHELDAKVAGHQLMKIEIDNQERDIGTLMRISAKNGLNEFRMRAIHPIRSNIGLPATIL